MKHLTYFVTHFSTSIESPPRYELQQIAAGNQRPVVRVWSLFLASVSGHVSEPPAVRTWRGYCAVTPSEPSDCTAGSMGAWNVTDATGCIQRCLGCARGRFVPFSPELQDCS